MNIERIAERIVIDRIAFRLVQSSGKSLHVFDFDDTLVTSKGSISIMHADGKNDIFGSVEFAYYEVQPGESLDFTDFNDVTKPRKIKKNFDKLKALAGDDGNRVVVLTARPKGSETAVKKYFASEGIKNVDIVALGSGDPKMKSGWIDHEIESKGYENVSFTDDSFRNVAAVNDIVKKHEKTKIVTDNPRHPREEDYDGGVNEKSFKSDNPTKAVSEIPYHQMDVPEPKSYGNKQMEYDWWDHQTPEFKKQYLQDHPDSVHHM